METLSSIFAISSIISLFAIMNPLSTASVFQGLTQKYSKSRRVKIAKRASVTAVFVLAVFAIAGDFIFNFFSITMEAFTIAGGLLIMTTGFSMLGPEDESLEQKQKEEATKKNISTIPLAIPMMAGPGSITTTLVLMNEANTISDNFAVIVAVILVSYISYLMMKHSAIIYERVSDSVVSVVNKLLGLIVLVIGVQFIINGIQGVLFIWRIL